jgi:hypothetical protein
MFRSSRRVNFVMRSAEGARRFASIRASRDPFASVEVDVRTAETSLNVDQPKRQAPRVSKARPRAEKPALATDTGARPAPPAEQVAPIDAAREGTPAFDPAPETSVNPAPQEPAAADAVRLRALTAPRAFPDALQEGLADALKGLGPDFEAALLFQADYMDGHSEYLLAISGAEIAQQDHIEAVVNTAISSFTRRDVELGMTFLDAEDPMAVRISRVGTRLV